MLEILPSEKSNIECKSTIRHLKAWSEPIDEWIRKATGIGFQELHSNIIGQAIVRNIRIQNAQCLIIVNLATFKEIIRLEDWEIKIVYTLDLENIFIEEKRLVLAVMDHIIFQSIVDYVERANITQNIAGPKEKYEVTFCHWEKTEVSVSLRHHS